MFAAAPPFAAGPFLTGALIGLGIIAAVETWGALTTRRYLRSRRRG